MASMRIMMSALAAAFIPAMVSASTSNMLDVGLQGACTGALCCAPGCQITIRDFHGCDSSVVFAGTCQDRFKNPTATLHPPTSACDDVQVTQLLDPDGNPSYDLYHKPSKTYDRYKFFNCGQPSAGGQCTVTGGGCDVEQTLTGAQG